MQRQGDVRKLYEDALASLIEKVKQDRYVIAAILGGSLSYDEVWEKSDIDLLLIGREEKKPARDYCLVENGVNIHVIMMARSKFKEVIEQSLQSSFFHSFFSKSTLLFTWDETIRDYYENIHRVGARDREIQLLRAGAFVLPVLAKAEKWLYLKGDAPYSFVWILNALPGLAAIEVLMHSEVTGREVIQQALRHNPAFFGKVYCELVNRPKTAGIMREALEMIDAYLDGKIHLLFKPILDFLTEAGGARSVTELDTHFKKRAQTDTLAFAYEWLADKGIIRKVSAPLRLAAKSQVVVDEAAYYYDGRGKS
ncbi:MAG: nucleotidyltransferase domain-containing protein [Armatimonadetes bacterium]|nr:nucleotidyltransferase domain-containing protein [Armatimonadota bacterium]